jgi:hypothetical protein
LSTLALFFRPQVEIRLGGLGFVFSGRKRKSALSRPWLCFFGQEESVLDIETFGLFFLLHKRDDEPRARY